MPMKHRAIRSSWLFEPNVWCSLWYGHVRHFWRIYLGLRCTDLMHRYVIFFKIKIPICNQYAMYLHRSSTCNNQIDLSLRCICFHGGLDLPMASASIKLQALQAKAPSPLSFGFSFSFSSFSFFLSPSRSPRGKHLNASFIVLVYDNP